MQDNASTILLAEVSCHRTQLLGRNISLQKWHAYTIEIFGEGKLIVVDMCECILEYSMFNIHTELSTLNTTYTQHDSGCHWAWIDDGPEPNELTEHLASCQLGTCL